MSRILTRETVEHLRQAATAIPQELGEGDGPWEFINALCLSHELLRSDLAAAETRLAAVTDKLRSIESTVSQYGMTSGSTHWVLYDLRAALAAAEGGEA